MASQKSMNSILSEMTSPPGEGKAQLKGDDKEKLWETVYLHFHLQCTWADRVTCNFALLHVPIL